jgi:predicted nucleic acid-binding protein
VTPYYVDSSALVKRYINEPGSGWMRAICDLAAGHLFAVAHIGLVEVAAALGAKHRQGVLEAYAYEGLLHDLWRDGQDQYWLIKVNQQVIKSAIELTRRQKLRGYDAVHLACGLLVNQQLMERGLPAPILLSSDLALLQAGRDEGLGVDDPNTHS